MPTATEYGNTPQRHFWMRGENPKERVVFDETTGIWNIYGYEESLQVMADTTTFSSVTSRLVPELKEFTEGGLTTLDPPRHTKLRKIVTKAFTPRVVSEMESTIERLAAELLDKVDGDRMDLVADFAYPLPVIVIADLLGIPASEREVFREWVDAMLSGTMDMSLNDESEEYKNEFARAIENIQKLNAFIGEHAESRRTEPRPDLLTKLVEAEVDGERLNNQEVVNFAALFLLAGHITTSMLLGNMILCLDEHPEQQKEVREDRALVPSAIEEALRMYSPFAAISRVTQTDAEVSGTKIPADQLISITLGAANRDERQFADPHTYDIRRDPNPHLAFGRGIHFCLGAPLARLEGRIAMNMLLDRFPHLRCDPAEPPEFLTIPNLTGPQKLPLLLTPEG
ncbi:cytochrome P450 [Amycolatopsis anabasis]|uniref:cytochrome P450 n=1 Tax=Amycolatopsis anabasis TaxID=1840409 RepID=UPI00131A90DC|nr:cytochrome P450 [Amycolatopsis anabasis]